VSPLVGLIVVGGALAVGVAGRALTLRLARRVRRREEPPPARDAPLGALGFGIEIGEVISLGGEELWLEGGWVLSEGREPVAALLPLREATLLALPAPRARLYRLAPVELRVDGEPPASVESGGARYDRVRRLPVELEPVGRGSDPPWSNALFVEYRDSSGAVLCVLSHDGASRVWQGRLVADDELERWGRA
jgi:hypothetical protein